MCCASSLGGNEVVHQALKAILSDQYASNLFRDETIVPAQVVEASIKAYVFLSPVCLNEKCSDLCSRIASKYGP